MNLQHRPPPGPNFQDHYDIPHIPQHFSAEIRHSFEVYGEIEGVPAEVLGWEQAATARERVATAAGLYRTMQDEPRPES